MRQAFDNPGEHDTRASIDIQAIAICDGFHTVAGERDGIGYVRGFDALQGSPPIPLYTLKHGNAYAYVRSLPGSFDATGIA